MGFLGNLSNRVKKYLVRDKEAQAKRLAKGATSAGALVGYGKDMLQVFGYDSISAYLNIENDLLSRYADYEEMDDTPELATALSVISWEATQNDYERKTSCWVTSPDRTTEDMLDKELLRKRLRLPEEELPEITRTLVKYGNNFEELLVDEQGVRGLNFLPPATVRRIEGPRGELYGFVQDFRGRYGYTPHDFQALIKKRFGSQGDPKNKQPGEWMRPNRQKAIALEDWEVAHFRLRGKTRRSIYGHCLAGDSLVWTDRGLIPIKDVKKGDRVFTRHAGMLRTTLVLDQVSTGEKQLYRLKTKHREIRLTAEHPVLVDRGGKNNKWVPVKDLNIGEKIVGVRNNPSIQSPPPLMASLLSEDNARYVLTDRGKEALNFSKRRVKYVPSDEGYVSRLRSIGLSRKQAQDLPNLKEGLPRSKWVSIFEALNIILFEGSLELASSPLDLPDFVEPWFCRLYGFLLGDGWIRDNSVFFALGEYDDVNKRYIELLERTGLKSHLITPKGESKPTQVCVYSKDLVNTFRDLGWINGAHNKEVPIWIHNLDVNFREEFIEGFIDADGWTTREGNYLHAELCNRGLLRGIKSVVDGLGWTAGNLRNRNRTEEKIIKGKKTRSSESWLLFFHKDSLGDPESDFVSEEIVSITEDRKEIVYDIEVADASHCFVADGLIVHNSSFEGARWIWKRTQLLEDSAMIYRLQRAAERFAFYVDTGDLPPAEALAFVNRVKQQYKKKKFFDPCLTGDTLVQCLDGEMRSLREMEQKGGDYWVYSFDLKTGEVVPGKATNARCTGKKVPVFRVVLDSGAVVRATADHPFLMRDGTYKDCADLKPNDRLMPLNLAQVRKGHDAGYVRLKQPSTGYFESVQQMVGRNMLSDFSIEDPVVHHKDGIKNNNDPSNLEVLSRRDHALEHLKSNLAMEKRNAEARPLQDELENLVRSYVERDPLLTSEELVEKLNLDEGFRSLYKKLPTTQRSEWSLPTFHTWIRRRGYKGYKAFKKEVTGSCRSRNHKYNEKVKTKGNNHRVVEIKFDGFEDVYNLDVDKYNNFGLVAGIFVHNSTGKLNLRWEPLSQDDDFFIPVRQGQEGTRIEVLGAPAWQHMEDIEYFRDKMFSAIMVPKAYLAQDANVARQILSNQDVAFARMVLGIQRELRNGISRICRIHLAAVGIDPYRVEYEVHMAMPSSIYELAQIEVMNARADLAARMKEFVSEYWILHNVFRLEDEDIELIMKQRAEDAERLAGMESQQQILQARALQAAGLAPDQNWATGVPQANGPQKQSTGQQAAAQVAKSQENIDTVVRRIADGYLAPRRLLASTSTLQSRYHPNRWEASIMKGDRQSEKRASAKIDRLLANDQNIAIKLNQLGSLLQEIKQTNRAGRNIGYSSY